MKYSIVDADKDHAWFLSLVMRDLDKQEVWASTASTPHQALMKGLDTADEAYTALADGIPFCMFGVSPVTYLGRVGTPWLLTSKEIELHQKELLRWSRKVAEHWSHNYSFLINYIDDRHKPALRWAKWVGFSVGPKKPFGPFRLPFHKIEMLGHV